MRDIFCVCVLWVCDVFLIGDIDLFRWINAKHCRIYWYSILISVSWMTILIRGDMHCVWNESDDLQLGIQVLLQAEHISRMIIPFRGRLWYAAHPLRRMFYEIRDRVVRVEQKQQHNAKISRVMHSSRLKHVEIGQSCLMISLKQTRMDENFSQKSPELHATSEWSWSLRMQIAHIRDQPYRKTWNAPHTSCSTLKISNRNLISAQIHH